MERFGHSLLPMDEALILAAVDLSGRGMLCWEVPMPTEKVGTFDTELAKEFWLAFTRKGAAPSTCAVWRGRTATTSSRGVFKAAARSLKQAAALTGATKSPPRKECWYDCGH